MMCQSIRITHIVPAIANEASGPSYSVVRLCESVISQGQEVTLAALDWAPIASPPLFLKVFPLGLGPRRLGRSPAMAGWLDRQALGKSVDILHNHSQWMMPNVYPGWVSRRHSIPLVVSPRGTFSAWAFTQGSFVKQWFWPLVQAPSLRVTTCFHATAMSEYEDIRRLGFHQPVAVIPNGIDIPDLKEQPQGKYRTLLFLGRVHPIKGLDLLLPAWQTIQYRFPDWRLRIVGPDNGGYLAQMQTLAKKLALTRIEFAGAVYGQQKWQVYRDADLFVLPTYSENFGMAVAESLAAGTPAVVTKGAPWQGLETQGAGWWIDIGLDPLVAALEQALAGSPAVLEEMGQRGRVWMMRDYSWQHIGQQMAATYCWLLHGGCRPDWVIED